MTVPRPPDDMTRARWEETRRRRRMLRGLWHGDLAEAARRLAGDRGKWLGEPNITSNPARMVVSQLSTVYDQRPIVEHADAAAAATMRALLDSAGWWQQAQAHAQLVIGCRESLVRLDIVYDGDDGGTSRLILRLVPADMVVCTASPDSPDEPETVAEYRLRVHPETGEDVWTVERWQRVAFEDGTAAYTGRIYDDEGNPTDLFGELPVYPVLPYVLYHATRTGDLWDAWCGAELFTGTLAVGVLMTDWMHLVLDCSWPQRVAIDATIPGLVARSTDDAPRYIQMDRSAVLNLASSRPDRPASIATWEPGGDPMEMLEAVQKHALDLAGNFDVQPADLARSHTDARSGYAIHITREGQRNAQRRYEPQFMRGDVELIGKVAAMWGALPLDGWRVTYPGLPLSPEERKQLLEDYDMRIERGLASRADALAAIEQIPRDEAVRRIAQIDRERAQERAGIVAA